MRRATCHVRGYLPKDHTRGGYIKKLYKPKEKSPKKSKESKMEVGKLSVNQTN